MRQGRIVFGLGVGVLSVAAAVFYRVAGAGEGHFGYRNNRPTIATERRRSCGSRPRSGSERSGRAEEAEEAAEAAETRLGE